MVDVSSALCWSEAVEHGADGSPGGLDEWRSVSGGVDATHFLMLPHPVRPSDVTLSSSAMVGKDARSHLSEELLRCAAQLGRRLQALRDRGKTPGGEAMQGLVIEEGEAEGLVAELAAHWARTADTPADMRSDMRPDIPRAATGESFLPLRHAVRQFDLAAVEYDALLLALAVELDGRFGRLVAYLNDHVGRTWPTLGLALGLHDAGLPPLALCERPVVRDGLLEIEGDGPAPGWSLLVPRDLVLRLAGAAAPDALPAGFRRFAPAPDLLDRLVLGQEARGTLARWVATAGERPLVLAGALGAGRTTAARGVAGALGCTLLVANVAADQMSDKLRAVRREARWHDAALLLHLHVPDATRAIDWRALWQGLDGLPRPLLIAIAPSHAEALAAAAPLEPALVALSEPTLAERAALWRRLLPEDAAAGDEAPDQLAARFRFNPGRIARAVRRAAPEGLTLDALMRACRAVGGAAMGPLAQKLPLPYAWDDLVVPPPVREELDLACVWLRREQQVLEQWGFGRRVAMGRGLTMLFGGQPGTGKTMAAQVLAGALGIELYRVDLSRVVNKYIGETEKNLSALFDAGHASGAGLLFDEADALFGKRSEVKEAHDRYANLEIGYLLQRMEEYDGVTILASNRARDMDEAFTRRFHFIIDFPMPDEAHRLRIWRGMIPPEAERDGALDLAALAKRFETSGGEIKNAALAAAFAAAGEQVPLGTRHLVQAVRREFRKGGRLSNERG